MGQQQLLLIVLGVIIVGVALVVGINLYNANARQAEIESMASECNSLILLAIEHYQKPVAFGGGGRVGFSNWNPPSFYTISDETPGIDRSYGAISQNNHNAHLWFDTGSDYCYITAWSSQTDVVDLSETNAGNFVQLQYNISTRTIQTTFYQHIEE